jgi:hypothetical protein
MWPINQLPNYTSIEPTKSTKVIIPVGKVEKANCQSFNPDSLIGLIIDIWG